MDNPNIDFDYASKLLDVVQKVATVAPAYLALSSVAMMELKEMNEEANAFLKDLSQQRLKEEQDAAAKINAHNQASLQADAENNEKVRAPVVKPVTVMPGEPNEVPEIQQRLEDTNAEGGVMGTTANTSSAPVIRRTALEANDPSKFGG